MFTRRFENKIALVKDESGGVEDYTEWIFLRPKCYSLLSADDSATHKAKCITRSTHFTHQQYGNVYDSYHPADDSADSPLNIRVEQRNIISHIHSILQ